MVSRISAVREGFAKRVGFLLVLGTLGAVTGVGWLMRYDATHRDTAQLRTTGVRLTATLVQLASAALAQPRREALQELLQAMRSHVAYAMVTDGEDRIEAHTDTSRIGQRYNPAIPDETSTTGALTITTHNATEPHHTQWVFSTPLTLTEGRLGRLHLGFTQPHLPLWPPPPPTLYIALIIGLLALLAFTLMRLHGAALQGVNAGLAEMERQAQWQALEASYPGEVGRLASHWNRAVAALQEAVEDVQSDNFELELTINVISYEKRRLSAILDKLSDAILITDSSSQVVFANKITEQFLKLKVDDVVGSTLQSCFPQPEMAEFLTRSAHTSHIALVRSIDTQLDPDRPDIYKVSFSVMFDDEENFVNGFLLIRNISHQKMEENARNEFIAAISHELKNPLSVVKSYVEILAHQDIDDDETVHEFYNTINDEADRMTRLIDNLINLSKMEMGSMQLQTGRVMISQLLADCFRAVESQAMAKGLTCDLRLPDKAPAVEIDKDLMGMVVMNLLTNALKYTPLGGEISVAAEEGDGEIRIHVKDSGIGIPEADLPRVFERFYRASNSEQATGGSGLGLAVAQQITQLHGGTITVSSQVDHGSHFIVTLPNNPQDLQLIGAGKYSNEDFAS